MAPGTSFIRWLKGKKSKDSHQAKIARLRQLPPIPPHGYEYGFRVNAKSEENLSETHVYEEIIYDDMPADLRGGANDSITDAMQNLDLSGAKTVGPYLVVPLRKGDTKMNAEEYRSLYSMFPEWAKHQMKDQNRKRQGFAISRGYSVDPPIQSDKLPSQQKGQRHNGDRRSGQFCRSNETTPNLLEKSHDSGHGSDSDSDGYLRSVSSGTSRTFHGNSRRESGISNESLSDLEVFADELDDEVEYFILKNVEQPKPQKQAPITKVPTANASTGHGFRRCAKSQTPQQPRTTSTQTQTAPKPTAKYHIEAEALIDQLYHSKQTVPVRMRTRPQQQSRTMDASTGLSSTVRSRDDFSLPTDASRMSCRISDFQLDRHRRRSMDLRTKSRNSSTSSSGVDSDYGSVYGPASRGLDHPRNRFLGDMMRANYDRQFMIPHL